MDAIGGVLHSSFNVVHGRNVRGAEREQQNPLRREVETGTNKTQEAQNPHGVQGMQGNINTENNVSTMFAYMNNSMEQESNSALWGSGTFGGAAGAASGAAMQVLQSAQNEIDNRSTALATEIAYGEARGMDVTQSIMAMANLSENRDVLETNLAPATAATGTVDVSTPGFAPEFNIEPPTSIIDLANEVEPVGSGGAGGAGVAADNGELPGFMVEGAFGGSVSEQIVAASAERDPAEMSVAEQISNQAKAEYAASINIMNPDNAESNELAAPGAVDATVRATDEVM
jgi:hypothetical protein